MSAVEKLVWDALGQAAMPLMFLFGFIAVSVAACLVLMWLDKRKGSSFVDRDQEVSGSKE